MDKYGKLSLNYYSYHSYLELSLYNYRNMVYALSWKITSRGGSNVRIADWLVVLG